MICFVIKKHTHREQLNLPVPVLNNEHSILVKLMQC